SSVTGNAVSSLPGGLDYTVEGGGTCCIGGACSPAEPANIQRCMGTFAMNAFQPQNTPVDPDPPPLALSGAFFNTLTNSFNTLSVTVDFSDVEVAGTTVLKGVANAAGNIPPNFAVEANGFRLGFADVETTAGFFGDIEVCGYYPDADNDGFIDGTTPPLAETLLRVLHKEGTDFVEAKLQHVDTNLHRV